ncbi:MAG: hypothetical protein HQK95_06750 [Nitrospirae bacterium]|nr:hypothetical protein [Nitrospirota bacterium]
MRAITQSDFRNAAKRHWDDAEYLLRDNRLANADQLFGLSAECALAAVMLLFTSIKKLKKNYKFHINELWDKFITFAEGRNAIKYTYPLRASNPFSNWSVEQRYYNGTSITKEIVDEHMKAAKTVKGILNKAILDGV